MSIIYETITRKDMAKAYLSEINNEVEDKIHLLNVKIIDFEKKVKGLEKENTELKEKIRSIDQTNGQNEKDDEKEKLVKLVKSLQDDLSASESACTDHLRKRTDLETRNIKLSKQVSDFEKIFVTERSRFRAEREECENQILELTEKVSDLQKTLAKERKELVKKEKGCEDSEKVNKESPENKKVAEKDFETEREIFESEIKKLTSKLAELSTNVMKEQRAKSDLQMKFNLIDAKRNKLSAKVKELESSVYSSRFSHADSCPKKNQMRPSNLFYNYSGYSSGNDHYKKGNYRYKKDKNLFVPKSPVQKNLTFTDKSFVKPRIVYSRNDLIRLSQKKTHDSNCGTNVSVKKDMVDNWYGSYYIASYRSTTPNKQGPKFRWVPKSV